MSYSPVAAVCYEEIRKHEYYDFVRNLCSNSHFEDVMWVCDRLARVPFQRKSELTLYFTKIPEKYLELAKYYAVIRLMKRISLKTILSDLASLSMFFHYFDRAFPETDWKNCGIAVALRFKEFLDDTKLSVQTKCERWYSLNGFFRIMKAWENARCLNPFSENPYIKTNRYDAKYIPKDIVDKLDIVFQNHEIPRHLRCIYWALRLIPSRINEVLAMRLDCLKPYNGHYCLFIPTWKQNGGYFEPEMRVIHIEDTGVAGELIRIIEEQQNSAREIQSLLKPAYKDYLFAYQKNCFRKNVLIEYNNTFLIAHETHVNKYFRYVCRENNILDKDGKPYEIGTHQFRHNGITDRLAAGFTPEQIRFMTAHHGDAMIYQAYAHLNLLPETIRQKQACVLKEPISQEPAILFGGRILNMEKQLEMHLLKNIRAHRVMGGICSDITGCKGDMTRCLECEFFIPDAAQLSFYEAQAASWYVKADKFALYPHIKDTAVRNAELFQNIVKNIHRVEGDAL